MALPMGGRRLLVFGGIAAVAMASASLIMMNGKSEKPATASAPAAARPNDLAAATTGSPVLPATTSPRVPADTSDELFERKKYTYRSLGRLDPFKSLIQPPGAASRLFAQKLDPESIRLVGILEKEGERRALVEDANGFGYILKAGDRVLRGRVTSIGAESMKIRHTLYGVTETTTLSLVRKNQGGRPNARLR